MKLIAFDRLCGLLNATGDGQQQLLRSIQQVLLRFRRPKKKVQKEIDFVWGSTTVLFFSSPAAPFGSWPGLPSFFCLFVFLCRWPCWSRATGSSRATSSTPRTRCAASPASPTTSSPRPGITWYLDRVGNRVLGLNSSCSPFSFAAVPVHDAALRAPQGRDAGHQDAQRRHEGHAAAVGRLPFARRRLGVCAALRRGLRQQVNRSTTIVGRGRRDRCGT